MKSVGKMLYLIQLMDIVDPKIAEKAAWDFIKSNDNVKFSLSTINPSFVFGPQSFGSEIKQSLNTSSEIINSILKLKPNDSIPASKGGWVDVRDVAKAHIIAFENEDAKIKEYC